MVKLYFLACRLRWASAHLTRMSEPEPAYQSPDGILRAVRCCHKSLDLTRETSEPAARPVDYSKAALRTDSPLVIPSWLLIRWCTAFRPASSRNWYVLLVRRSRSDTRRRGNRWQRHLIELARLVLGLQGQGRDVSSRSYSCCDSCRACAAEWSSAWGQGLISEETNRTATAVLRHSPISWCSNEAAVLTCKQASANSRRCWGDSFMVMMGWSTQVGKLRHGRIGYVTSHRPSSGGVPAFSCLWAGNVDISRMQASTLAWSWFAWRRDTVQGRLWIQERR